MPARFGSQRIFVLDNIATVTPKKSKHLRIAIIVIIAVLLVPYVCSYLVVRSNSAKFTSGEKEFVYFGIASKDAELAGPDAIAVHQYSLKEKMVLQRAASLRKSYFPLRLLDEIITGVDSR